MSSPPDRPFPDGDPFGFESESWLSLTRAAALDDPLGSLGPYTLLEEVARGGQGVVYRARDTRTGSVVAVKRLAEGAFAGPTARERLAREIDVVSRLDHPSIPRLLDVERLGSQSILVLEWVDGVPVTRWAAETPRSARDIVARFADAADAILHAHQRGVVHRDLKPSNLLITPDEKPRILDFGLAMRLDADETLLTRAGQFLGTPAYASPEQREGRREDVDVRSDVYSLAVVLFECLAGSLPFGTHRPERADVPRLAARVDGADQDLDAILRRALALSPADRFASMDAFASDLRRWHRGDEIEARWPTPTEQLGRAMRRHRWIVAGVALAVTVSIAFGATMGVLRQEAHREAERAERVQQFVSSILLPDASGSVSLDATLVDLLENASRRVDEELGGDREATLRVRMRMAGIYRQLWMWEEAGREATRALPDAEFVHGAESPETARVLALLSLSAAFADDPAAVDHARRALEIRRRVMTDQPRRIASAEANLAFALGYTGGEAARDEADRHYRASIVEFERLGFDAGPDHAGTLYAYAAFLQGNGRLADCLERYEEALAVYDQLPVDYDQHRIRCLTDFASALCGNDRLAEAGPLYERAVQEGSESRSDPWTVRAVEGLARYRELQGRKREARDLLARTMELQSGLARPVWSEELLLARIADLDAAL